MLKSLRCWTCVHKYLRARAAFYSTITKPAVTVEPPVCLVDEVSHIRVTGLAPGQVVTLTARLQEEGAKFKARGVYRANKDGHLDLKEHPSLAGTYTDVNEMGLFWSMKPIPGQMPGLRLFKKDVSTPLVYKISVYSGKHAGEGDIHQPPMTSAVQHRLFKSPGVLKIPVTEGPFRGTIFVPEGAGPFPALLDAHGAMVTLVETRAALLASRGYATLALGYINHNHLPKTVHDVDPNYFKEAVEWFSQQEYVDEERVGVIGLCFGGFFTMTCAAICPKVKVVVNINGTPVVPVESVAAVKSDHVTQDFQTFWAKQELVYVTDEGIVVKEACNCDVGCIPAWQHGAKILTIVGEDDKQVNPKWHSYYHTHCPPVYRPNLEMVRYPGAGHVIDPPYTPTCRAMNPDKDRLASIGLLNDEFQDKLLMAGGFMETHAYAQEDSWRRILEFLDNHLKQANN